MAHAVEAPLINNVPDHFNPLDSSGAVEEAIPTVDYSLLFSSDPHVRSTALHHLSKSCQEHGFFNLVNHGVPPGVIDGAIQTVATFINEEDQDTKNKYLKNNPDDEFVYGRISHDNENRERAFEVYTKALQDIKYGLAKAISKILGLEENYIEKVFKFESGLDFGNPNIYPPRFGSDKSLIGLDSHTDPGFIISLTQNMDGGPRIRTDTGKWIKVSIPPNAILIQLGDQPEVLTNGKFKSHVHHVVLSNNKAQRISIVGLHGPALDALVSPAAEFVDQSHPPAYRGLTYKESLDFGGYQALKKIIICAMDFYHHFNS